MPKCEECFTLPGYAEVDVVLIDGVGNCDCFVSCIKRVKKDKMTKAETIFGDAHDVLMVLEEKYGVNFSDLEITEIKEAVKAACTLACLMNKTQTRKGD